MYPRDNSVHVGALAVSDHVDHFAKDPIGRCLIGPTYVVWCATTDLQGAIMWGALDEPIVRELLDIDRMMESLPPVAKRRSMLVDCQGVTQVDADAMLGFTTLASDRVPVWAVTLIRQAVIVPAGLPGILIGGAWAAAGSAHPQRFVHNVEQAVAYLDHPAAQSAHEAAAHVADGLRGCAVVISRLSSHLGRDLTAPTLESSAAALGMSPRTLQRELSRADTSFSEELRRARIAAATSLLLHTDLKIDAIAVKVGLGNASRMSAALRRELNVTASGLRARFRGQHSERAWPPARDREPS